MYLPGSQGLSFNHARISARLPRQISTRDAGLKPVPTPVCHQDFFGPSALADPGPIYHEMLDLGPVCWLERNAIHAITHHNALTAALRNWRVFQSGQGVSIDEEINPRLVGSTLNSDPPIHDQSRAISGAPLTPKALEKVAGRIAASAGALVDRLVKTGEFDAAAEMAPYLPLTIVRDLVGLSDEAQDRMLAWAAATFELMGDAKDRRPQALADLGEMRAYLGTHGRPEKLAKGGWAQRLFVEGERAGLSAEKCAEMMRDYINPSLDTTIAAIGYGVRLFADHPEQWQLLRDDPALIGNAIEEIVRLNTPIRAFTRYVAEDIEVAEVPLAKGSRVLMVWGAGNRDAAKFPDPDRFDIARNTRGHVGFGHGVHACMGMHLARLEMRCLFEALLARVERFELTGPVVPVTNATICAYKAVPVRVVPIG